jgi:TRAP-type C4-dicarboxylate transport system permease small subunit
MTKQTGTIITVVVAALTLLCCTAPLCVGSIMIFAELGDWSTTLGPNVQTGDIPPAYGIAPCCLSILALVVPLLCWLFLVRGKSDAVVEEEYIEGSFEEDTV